MILAFTELLAPGKESLAFLAPSLPDRNPALPDPGGCRKLNAHPCLGRDRPTWEGERQALAALKVKFQVSWADGSLPGLLPLLSVNWGSLQAEPPRPLPLTLPAPCLASLNPEHLRSRFRCDLAWRRGQRMQRGTAVRMEDAGGKVAQQPAVPAFGPAGLHHRPGARGSHTHTRLSP